MGYVITGIFIFTDYVTGIIKAIAQNELSSSRMREGLFHKFAYVIIVFVGYIIDYAQTIFYIGFEAPISESVCVFIILIEISSIIENCIAINPELQNTKIGNFFKVK